MNVSFGTELSVYSRPTQGECFDYVSNIYGDIKVWSINADVGDKDLGGRGERNRETFDWSNRRIRYLRQSGCYYFFLHKCSYIYLRNPMI